MGTHIGKDLSKKLYPLLPEERALIPPEHLWLFRVEGKVFGPYTLKNLQAYLLAHAHYPDSTRVQNERDKKWISPHDSELFDRRKYDSSAQAGQTPQEEVPLYLLVEGQKIGPLPISEIQHKLQEKKILLTDYWAISTRGPWKKIFEHPHFDRRKISLLPTIPTEKPEPLAEVLSIRQERNSPYKEISPLIDALSLNHSKSIHGQSFAKNSGLSFLKSQARLYQIGLIGAVLIFMVTAVSGVYKLFFQPSGMPEMSVEEKTKNKRDDPQNRRPADNRTNPSPSNLSNNPSITTPPQQIFPSDPPPPSYEPPTPDDGGYQHDEPPPPEETFVEPPHEDDANREIASEEPAPLQEGSETEGLEETPTAEQPMEGASNSEDIIE